MNRKYLLFYISKYSGHFQAAKAIEKALLKVDDKAKIKMINAFDYTNPILGRIITKTYLHVIRNRPEIWANVYDNPGVLEKIRKAREFLHTYNRRKIKTLIEDFAPDTIYCTQAFPCGMVADYKKTFGKSITLVAVLTDHAPHSYWIFDEVDIFVTPSRETARILEEKGVPPRKIRVYGIPVNPVFGEKLDKESIRSEYGISPDRRTILIMGGSQGLGAVENAVRSILGDRTHNYQIMVVTGINKKLYNRLQRMVPGTNSSIKLFSYVEHIDKLMAISDIIITKAGGITTAEALAKGLPILVVNPIPGQERMNTDHLVSEGAAIEAKDHRDIYRVITDIFESKDTLARMRDNSKRLAMPDSALKIAELGIRGV